MPGVQPDPGAPLRASRTRPEPPAPRTCAPRRPAVASRVRDPRRRVGPRSNTLGGGGFGIESSAVGHSELQFDEVEPGGLFGDRVLDLQPGVHLQEVELAVIVGEELHRSGAGVADRAGGQPGRVEQLGAHARRALDQRRGGLLDDLLVTALNRAFAFPDGPHRAVGVGEDLDLDVVPGGQVTLAEHGRVAERRLRFAARRRDFAGQRGQFAHHPHAAAAAARGRLDQHRQLRLGDGVGIEFVEHRAPRRRPSASWTRSWSPSRAPPPPAARSRSGPPPARRPRTRRSPRGIRNRDAPRRRRRRGRRR